jgi:hypothetical protein
MGARRASARLTRLSAQPRHHRPCCFARDAELAAQWLPATSPQGHRCQLQVSQAEVLADMRRAGWRVHEPSRPAEAEREAV